MFVLVFSGIRVGNCTDTQYAWNLETANFESARVNMQRLDLRSFIA